MTADKRSVHTDALETLGTIISPNEKRDAIHIAVEPVQAGERLRAGEHVHLVDGKAYLASFNSGVGIVDPYLNPAFTVVEGEWFWLLVYPRKITSLRHVWEHPDFAPAEVTLEDIALLAIAKTADPFEKAEKAQHRFFLESKKWMTDWALEHMSYDYHGTNDGHDLTAEQAYDRAIEAGHDEHIGPYESARDYIDDEWWDHWENLTGEEGNRGRYFSCSC